MQVEEMAAQLSNENEIEFNLSNIPVPDKSLSSAIQSHEELAHKVAAMVAELNRQMMELFSGSILELFRDNPSLAQLSWRQYTPYFNDGDECVFHVDEYSLQINGFNEDFETWMEFQDSFRHRTVESFDLDDDYLPDSVKELLRPDYVWPPTKRKSEWSDYMYPRYDDFVPYGSGAPLENVRKTVMTLLATVDDDVFKAIYGNHVTVTYERDPNDENVVYCYTRYFDHD